MKRENQTVGELLTTKEVLTSDEAAQYMGVSKSHLYKLTCYRKIPHFKPMGKMCYFNRLELEAWLQSNRVATNEEIEEKAMSYHKGARA
jgi:excisionase family DNA binding protein